MADLTELNVGQGETFKIMITLLRDEDDIPLDVEDLNIYGQIRENYTTDEVSAEFVITKLLPFTSGSFFVELSPEQTIELNQRKYVYDINAASVSENSVVRRILEGQFTVRPTATR
jgi:hypothetical protein